MRGLVGCFLALGLAVSPAVAKAGRAAGDDPAAKGDKPAAAATTAPAASSTASADPGTTEAAAPDAAEPTPAAAPAPAPQGENPSPLYFSIGSAHFTPGGFLDATNVFRTKYTGNGIGTNFAAIPYNNNLSGGAGLTEDRFSLQNSRLTLRVDSNVAGGTAVGYLEADFLGNAPTGLNVTSNSNVLRMRVYFLDYTHGKFEVLFGQDWSMLTANRVGIGFMPGDVFYTQEMDTNYQMGLVWERTAQIRFVYHPSKTVAFGVSLENPEQYAPTSVTFPTTPSSPIAFSTTQVDQGASTGNVPNVFPDVIAKIAFDPKFGSHSAHFEVVGDYRIFRIDTFTGSTNFGNTTISGGGGGVNANVEIFKNFRLLETAFWSDGGGRLIANSGVPDFIVLPAATASSRLGLSAVHSGSGIAGFEYQTTPKLLLYGYFSGVYVNRAEAGNAVGTNCVSAATCVGYGFPGSASTNNRLMHEGTLGWVQYFWRSPNYGAVSMINQLSYLDRYPWDPTNTGTNHPKNAHDVTAFIDLRYTLP